MAKKMKIKMKIFAHLLVLSLLFCCCQLAVAEDKLNEGEEAEDASFILVNHTGAAIVSLRISPSLADHWSDNLLGDEQIADQDEVEIAFTDSDEAELWDLQTTDAKGEETEWPGVPLGENKKVILSFEDDEPVVTYQ